MSQQKLANAKPRVMLIPDTVLWILGTWAKEIVKWNSQKYEFVICPTAEIWENERLFLSVLQEVEVAHCLSQWDFGQIQPLIDRGRPPDTILISTIHHIVKFSQVEDCLHADKIMVVCQKYLDELVQKGVPREKIVLIYNGVDTEFFSPKDQLQSKKKFGIPPQAFTIGFSAKVSSDHDGRKGIDTFLKVLSKLSLSLKSNIHVILTGPGWDERIKNYPLDGLHMHYFSFLPTTQMPDFYSALDVYLVTSRVEGGPVPLLEAMSCGTAVVTTPVGTALDFVKDDFNGLMVPTEDVESIAKAIQKIHSDKKLCERLSSAGRETILQNLQWRDTVSKIDRLYGNSKSTKNCITKNRMKVHSFTKLNARFIRRDMKRWEKRFGLESKWRRLYEKVVHPLIKLRKVLQKGLFFMAKKVSGTH